MAVNIISLEDHSMPRAKLHLAVIVISCLTVLCPKICFSETIAGYQALTQWSKWPLLRKSEKAGLASSYDRLGTNYDFSYYEEPNGLRTLDETVNVATIQGPGVIYRFWMPHYTANRNFDIRMYFDGEPSPRINTNSVQWLGGSFNYFSSPLVDTCAGGQVSYEPIPFKHSVRIETENKALPSFPTWEPNRHYYQYTYMTFPNDPGIESYTGALSPSQQIARDEAVSLFNNNGLHPGGNSLTAIDINTPASLIADGAVLTLANLSGPGMIRKLNIKMVGANDADLEGLRLRVFYDSNSIPAIDAAVGNFFGAGKGRTPYKSLPMGTDSPDGFYCYWPMPFRDWVRVELYNSSQASISIDSAIVQYDPQADVRKMCYLYAAESKSVKQPGQIYHPILTTTGCGHYVGNLLYIEQPAYSFWMIEGDEVITIDGGNILYGTGLEDAYNGGYYYNWVARISTEPEGLSPRSAFRPLSGILYVHRQGGIEYARADQYRWQIADCVPFSNSLEVKIENRYAATGADWTSVAFWYQYHCTRSDFDSDCDVDYHDFAFFSSHWLRENCIAPNDCSRADFDANQIVDSNDLPFLFDYWLWRPPALDLRPISQIQPQKRISKPVKQEISNLS